MEDPSACGSTFGGRFGVFISGEIARPTVVPAKPVPCWAPGGGEDAPAGWRASARLGAGDEWSERSVP